MPSSAFTMNRYNALIATIQRELNVTITESRNLAAMADQPSVHSLEEVRAQVERASIAQTHLVSAVRRIVRDATATRHR